MTYLSIRCRALYARESRAHRLEVLEGHLAAGCRFIECRHHVGWRIIRRQLFLESRTHVRLESLRIDRKLAASRITQRLVLVSDDLVARIIDRLIARDQRIAVLDRVRAEDI